MKFKITYLLLFAVLFSFTAVAQTEKLKIYNPDADAAAEIAAAVKKADAEGKHVLLQIGGNWCSWCIKFHQFTTTDAQLDSALKAGYVVQKVNYSKENHNLPVLEKLAYPQRFGFPVFVVLNSKGERIHTQNSAYLEEGQGYSKKKVL
ncbi:MAG: thioredoxin family protein, partial [Hymenobacteraceae bacterium]|nr:thioredoxin family protein [Hymenobacteraceae bacterium]